MAPFGSFFAWSEFFFNKIFCGDQKDDLDNMSCDPPEFWTPLVTLRPVVGAIPRSSIGNIEAKWSENGSEKSWPENGQNSILRYS